MASKRKKWAGKKASVKLAAAGQSFSWWKAHPEASSGEH